MTIQKVTVDTKEAAAYLGLSVDFMKRARVTGKGAVFIKLGRKVVYRIDDLNKFLDANAKTNSSKRI